MVRTVTNYYGTEGNDRFDLRQEFQAYTQDVVYGYGGADFIREMWHPFYSSDDEYYGGKGEDTIESTAGNDLLSGGKDDDFFIIRLESQPKPGDPDQSDDPFNPKAWEMEIRGGEGDDTAKIYDSVGTLSVLGDDHFRVKLEGGGAVDIWNVETINLV